VHVPLEKRDLREILCFEYRRPASRDYAVSFERRLFQILKNSRPLPRPGGKVAARVRLNGSLDIYCCGKKLSVKEIKPGERKEAAWHRPFFLRGTFLLCVDVAIRATCHNFESRVR
jgi:hypothetical protein